jgi:hypothetical protein
LLQLRQVQVVVVTQRRNELGYIALQGV